MSESPDANGSSAGKVTRSHLARSAYLYVRQSTLRQVLTNTESGARQYALRQRAIALGWPAEQIITIDCDQGQSGASAADRAGFQRLVAEVGIGRAGIVLGLEVSRLARNNADWHRLLELCSLSRTLILDEDGLYDPDDFNDRLLLGLKGTMSEAELHFIRARLRGGQLSKARRGELKMALPVGLVYDAAERVTLDPDQAVQRAVRLLFDTFTASGSARAVVKAFKRERLTFPARIRAGAHKGELTWAPLRHWRVLRTLHNPRYAGAFAYGRHRSRATPEGGSVVEPLERHEWTALIHDAHPGYISWETYERNQTLLAANAAAHGGNRSAGPAREGPALLQGLTICGRCGKRMTVRYHQRNGYSQPDYQCQRDAIESGDSRCQSIPGQHIDHTISRLILDTLTPHALQTALSIHSELAARAEEADRLRATHVERARHHADLARRRYLSVDPDNRLVADTLEADWNDALRALRDAQDTLERAKASDSALTNAKRERIHALAHDIPRLWHDPNTPQRERKRIIRHIIEDVTLTKADAIHIHIRYRGGTTTSLSLATPAPIGDLRRTPAATITELDRLLEHHTDADTAQALNANGHTTGTGQPFTPQSVQNARSAHNIPSLQQRLRAAGMLTRRELAHHLHVHTTTITKWHHADIITGIKANDKNQYLYPPPSTQLPPKRQGSKLANRQPTPQPMQSPLRGAI
jgi:DNA invertase Pin-like site-specific DNA recombinase